MTDVHAWLLAGLIVGSGLTIAGALGLWWRLVNVSKLLAAESARLDWLDARVMPVVESQGYGNPYGEHVANAWSVEWPSNTVRDAIDAYRANNKDEP